MTVLLFADRAAGPYERVVVGSDALACDDQVWPFTVIGEDYALVEDPPGPLNQWRRVDDAWVAAPPPEPQLVVPMAVDMRQARIKLHREGVLAVVDGMIEAANDPEVAIEWRFAKEVRRDHPFINGVQLLLGKTTPEMDLWFVQASQIGPMGAE